MHTSFLPNHLIAEQPEGVSVAEQHRAARARMLAMQFEDYEREVRRVLNALLGTGGFDAARDILAITVNLWPHGYRDSVQLTRQRLPSTPGSSPGRDRD